MYYTLVHQILYLMKLKNNIALSNSGFLFNPSTGDSYSLNPIAKEILKLLEKQRSKSEIKQFILNTYQVDETSFEKDFYDFTNQLKNFNLIEDAE